MKKVRDKDGREGFVIRDSFRCCSPEEDLVVYNGMNIGVGTDKELLEMVSFEVPIPDLKKCGAGRGKECCIFTSVGADGVNCERFTSLRDTLIFRKMTSERNPTEPYPECMIF